MSLILPDTTGVESRGDKYYWPQLLRAWPPAPEIDLGPGECYRVSKMLSVLSKGERLEKSNLAHEARFGAGAAARRLRTAGDKGRQIHEWIAARLTHGEEGPLPPDLEPARRAWEKLNLEYGFVAYFTEKAVAHPILRYSGTLDYLGVVGDDEVALVDWKRSPRPYEGHILQAGAYMGCLMQAGWQAVPAYIFGLWDPPWVLRLDAESSMQAAMGFAAVKMAFEAKMWAERQLVRKETL